MKKLLLMALAVSTPIIANERMYVEAHRVVISGNSIFVHEHGDTWIKTKALYSDKDGIYIVDDVKCEAPK
jgi:hypothetical protein